MKTPRVWVLVADGSRARILRDPFRKAESEESREELVFRAEQRQLREIMADKPGRSFASEGARRSSIEYRSDPVREDERAFASLLTEVLDSHRRAGDFDRLAVVAAPRMLGDLRHAFTNALRGVTIREIPRDLTKMPAPELRGALVELDVGRVPLAEPATAAGARTPAP